MIQTRSKNRYAGRMRQLCNGKLPMFFVGSGALVLALMLSVAWSKPSEDRAPRIIGPYDSQDGCEKCHESEVEAWRASSHHGTLDLLHKHDEAPKIFAKLREANATGLGTTTDPRLAPRCARCHATTYARPNHTKGMPFWGVSCESCHGPAERWVHGHGAYRVSGRLSVEEKRKLETPANRTKRLAEASAAGMVRPEDLFGLASNCLGCHVVDDAELIEVGGHPSQSAGFEFMSWTQGEVRHNFLRSGTNAPSNLERRRLMYLVGRLAELHAGVRALAKTNEKGGYAKATIGRIEGAVDKLFDLSERFEGKPLEERLFEIIELIYDEDEEEVLEQVRPGNATEVTALAQALRERCTKLATELAEQKTSLAPLDELMEKEKPKGEPYDARTDK